MIELMVMESECNDVGRKVDEKVEREVEMLVGDMMGYVLLLWC